MISALVLTYNEENIIHQCLTALRFADEMIVFDSFSNDQTIKIAQQLGAKVVQRTFDNYAAQRNEALKSVSPSADWILMVDADEIVTPDLQEEILTITSHYNNPVTLYRVRRKDMFQEKWIRHSSGYPTWFGRLFRNGKVWIEREINEEYHTSGQVGYLKHHLTHYPFNKGMAWWIEKHNRYSSMEATILLEKMNERPVMKDLFSADPANRRKAQKGVILRLPFRPWIVFFALYILRCGFLDGSAGYTFCKLRKMYEWMIDLKIKELQNTKERSSSSK